MYPSTFDNFNTLPHVPLGLKLSTYPCTLPRTPPSYGVPDSPATHQSSSSHRDDHQLSLQQPRVSQADLDNLLVPRPPPSDPSKGSQRRGSVNRARVERGERVPLAVGSDVDVGGRQVEGE